MVTLEELGQRICIIGPSATGKSTLAVQLARKLQLPCIHLDQLAHLPNTDWKLRDRQLFAQDHDHFLHKNKTWIIEGNYNFLMRQRFAAATTVIWLDFSAWSSLWHYSKRSWQQNPNRAGNLIGASQQWRIKQLRQILFKAPKNRKIYKQLIEDSGVRWIQLRDFSTLQAYYKHWDLQLP